MNADDQGRVGEQNKAYRRGLVLGLTMAEVGILIIFVLLLLIMFREWSDRRMRERTRERTQGSTVVQNSDLTVMKNNQATFNEIQKTLGLGPNPPPEAVTKLVRAIHDIVSTPDGASALAALKSQVEQARLEREEVKKALMSSGKSAGEADASIKIATQEGQLKHYEKQLLASGQGKGERPCWVKPDGKIEYLYDVKLASDGIHLREYVHSTRVADRARLPMPQVEPSEALDPEEFLRRTRPLFDAGIAENCRFFVVVYDGTAPDEKPLYKQLLRTVEGHFYKRLDQRDAPF